MNQKSNQPNQPTESERIFVMPTGYLGRRQSLPPAPRPQTMEQLPAGQAGSAPKKSKLWLKLVIIFGLVIIAALLVWLIMLNYSKPAAPAPPVAAPAVIAPEPAKPEARPEPEIETQPEVETPPEVEAQPEVEIQPEPIVPAGRTLFELKRVDTDADGLTDDEELLLGTDPNLPDSDQDEFGDGSELLNLFNPLARDPAGLEFSGLVTTYVNPIFGYNVFYPKKWQARALDKANAAVVFTSPMEEYVTIKTFANDGQLELLAWYQRNYSDQNLDQVVSFTNKNKLPGIRSANGFDVFFSMGATIYNINYNTGLKEQVSYPNLFQIMVESFVFTFK